MGLESPPAQSLSLMSSCINHFSHPILPLMPGIKFLVEKWESLLFSRLVYLGDFPQERQFSPQITVARVRWEKSLILAKLPQDYPFLGSRNESLMFPNCWNIKLFEDEAEHEVRLFWLQQQSNSKEKWERDQFPPSCCEWGSGAAPKSQGHFPWKGFSCPKTKTAHQGQTSLQDVGFFPPGIINGSEN